MVDRVAQLDQRPGDHGVGLLIDRTAAHALRCQRCGEQQERRAKPVPHFLLTRSGCSRVAWRPLAEMVTIN